MGSFLPLPSREAVEMSIGKGGNGTISIVYFKGAEFAVNRVSNTRWCTSYRVACDIRTGDLWHVTLVRMWNTYVMQLVTHVQYVCVECATPDRPTPPMHADHTSIHTYTCTYHSPHTPRLAVAIYKTCKQFVQSALESAVSALLTCQVCPSTSGRGWQAQSAPEKWDCCIVLLDYGRQNICCWWRGVLCIHTDKWCGFIGNVEMIELRRATVVGCSTVQWYCWLVPKLPSYREVPGLSFSICMHTCLYSRYMWNVPPWETYATHACRLHKHTYIYVHAHITNPTPHAWE